MRCLIFGGNGFIGSHLAEGLIKQGYDVKVFDDFKSGKDNLSNIKENVEIIKGDFFNETEISNALKDIDYVFHYIYKTTPATAIRDPVYDIQSNLVGSVRLFQEVLKSEVKKIIFPSSGGTIYGITPGIPAKEDDPTNPINPYSISKLAIEQYLKYLNYINGLDYLILRYSNPYGERQNPHGMQGVIPIFLNKIKHGENPKIYGDGSMIRDYIYIEDAIEASIAVLKKRTNENIFNIGSGKGTSLNELIDIISDVLGFEVIPNYIENSEKFIPKIVLDISRIQSVTGWSPTTELRDGINKTWMWIKKM